MGNGQLLEEKAEQATASGSGVTAAPAADVAGVQAGAVGETARATVPTETVVHREAIVPAQALPRPKTAKRPRKKGAAGRLFKTLGIILGSVVLLCALLLGALYIATGRRTVEVGERAQLGLPTWIPGGDVLCMLPKTVPNTSEVGEVKLSVRLFGIIPREMTVTVTDSVPPVLQLHKVSAAQGVEVLPEDFVASCEDRSAVRYHFETAPDTASLGTQTVSVYAEDEGGNRTLCEAELTVLEDFAFLMELGATSEEMTEAVKARFADVDLVDRSAVDAAASGMYRLPAVGDGVKYVFALTLEDTVAPTGMSVDLDWPLGLELKPEQLVAGVMDLSPVTYHFVTKPDLSSTQRQYLTVAVSDASGNTGEFQSSVRLWDIPTAVTVEAGTPQKELEQMLFQNTKKLEIDGYEQISHRVGTQDITVMGELTGMPVQVTVVDTVPPVAEPLPYTTYIGVCPGADMLVTKVVDGSELTFAYAAAPDVSKEQTVPVLIKITDLGGNSITVESLLTVVPDTVPPEIKGAQDIYITVGGTASYRKGVSATDNVDELVSLKVDASAVDTKTEGSYPVIYSATDAAGNYTEVTVKAVVGKIGQESVDAFCDEILATIITEGMNEEQRAEAIYEWCVGHIRYSTSTSHLMGQFLPAAYSGFNTRRGNCYIYYSVCSALLTRSGIENIEVRRNSVSNPHYWNLVKIDGEWYHVDTCPQYRGFEMRAFMLTDAQLAWYNTHKKAGYYSFNAEDYPATPE